MKTYSEYIAAGSPLTLAVGGSVLYVQRSEAGQVLDIEFFKGNASQSVQRVGKGFKAQPVGGFDTIRIKASDSGTVDFIVTDGDLNVQFDDANTIIGNDDGQAVPIRAKAGERIPVEIGGSTVQVTADNVGINNTTANPVPVKTVRQSQIIDYAPTNVGTASVLLVSDAALQGLRFRNPHATARIALGGAAVTMANAAIVLEPGDIWNETDAPGAEWHAISDTAGASVLLQGLK